MRVVLVTWHVPMFGQLTLSLFARFSLFLFLAGGGLGGVFQIGIERETRRLFIFLSGYTAK